jgi:3-deoxy-D-manno-octulosonic-acid transferase
MNLLLWILYPFLKFLSLFIFWLPEFQERRMFEIKNDKEPGARSFKQLGVVADICFEFSSEGEYQQVASLVDDALLAGKKIELVFFSPSVEKAIRELYERHPEKIRYYRYPIIAFSPFKMSRCFSRWCTSKKLVLVRYDFFPEFLLWSKKKNHELLIVWASLKKERLKQKNISWFKSLFYKNSSQLIFASVADQEKAKGLGFAGKSYDFRIEQIRRRVVSRVEKFQRIFQPYESLKKLMEHYPREKRLIIGNAWPQDLFLLRDLPEDFFVMVIPHQLSTDILNAMKHSLEELDRAVILVDDAPVDSDGDTFLINKKGVLCELYADFGHSYVGGGFGAGVHSILEPLVAGSESIACGPRHERSTEFDVAKDLNRMIEVNTPEEFLNWLLQKSLIGREESLQSAFNSYADFRKEVISC